MSIADRATHLDHHLSTAQTPAANSDLALLSGMSAGDDACAAELKSRHAPSVSVLTDAIGADAVHEGWERFADGFRSGSPVTAPVRVHWLMGALGLREGERCSDQDDAIWHAFVGLSPGWQTALWHAEVEYDDAPAVARLLGIDAVDARRAVASAMVAVRRSVASRHEAGSAPDCHWLADEVRDSRDIRMSGSAVRVLREHGRHCDDCLPLVREVFRVENSLREILAGQVLGRHAGEYLRTRPRSRGIALAPMSVSAPAVLARRASRPVLGVLASGLTAAAVLSAFMITTPDLGASSTPGTAAPSLQRDNTVDLTTSIPPSQGPGVIGRPVERVTLVSSTTGDGTKKGSRGEGPRGGQDEESAATDDVATAPVDPVPGNGDGLEPAAPADDTGPPSGAGPDQEPEAIPEPEAPDPGPTGGSNQARDPVVNVGVDLDEDTGSVAVTVDLPVASTDPFVVETPALPLPPLAPVLESGLLP
ncbi:hypothetical protein BH09ACT12_BH09ACT12_08080 [soil metagenome]